MTKVLITNGENLRSLIFIRALAGKSDVDLHVSSQRKFSAGFYSRYCVNKFVISSPKNEVLFIKQLIDYIITNSIDVLIPMNADEIDVVLKNRTLFPKNLIIPFVDYKTFTHIKDKWNFFKLAESLKVPTPRTIKVTNIVELENIKLPFPLIVKIRTGAGSKGVEKVENTTELIKTFKDIVKEYKLDKDNYPLIQEYISDGEYYCVSAFCKKGVVKSTFVYKSLRQYPIDHGTSTSRISVKDKEMEMYARKMLVKLKWHGVAQFDLIKKDGKLYFLEMNPRLYTSLNLTVQSGLNYPYYLCVDCDIPKDYKIGVVCRIILSDTLVFFKSIFRKKKYSWKEYFSKHYTDDLLISDFRPTLPLLVKFFRGKLL